MRDVMAIIWVAASVLVMSLAMGCQTMRTAANTALTVGGVAKPEYAAAIKQIQSLIAGGPVNPVEGFTFETIWRYQGQMIDAKDLTREDRFWRVQTANEAGLVTVVHEAGELTTEDAALRSQIERILQASGVIDE